MTGWYSTPWTNPDLCARWSLGQTLTTVKPDCLERESHMTSSSTRTALAMTQFCWCARSSTLSIRPYRYAPLVCVQARISIWTPQKQYIFKKLYQTMLLLDKSVQNVFCLFWNQNYRRLKGKSHTIQCIKLESFRNHFLHFLEALIQNTSSLHHVIFITVSLQLVEPMHQLALLSVNVAMISSSTRSTSTMIQFCLCVRSSTLSIRPYRHTCMKITIQSSK